jgi:nicotinamidase-related amidase
MQQGLIGMLPDAVFNPVVKNTQILAAAFRDRGLPVVLVTADGLAPGRTEQPIVLGELPPRFADVVSELGPEAGDILITKQTWGVFARSDLEARLKALGITQVVVTGVATSHGVESTARAAYEAGFNVALAIDAMADPDVEMHDQSIRHVFPRLGETGTAAVVRLAHSYGPRKAAATCGSAARSPHWNRTECLKPSPMTSRRCFRPRLGIIGHLWNRTPLPLLCRRYVLTNERTSFPSSPHTGSIQARGLRLEAIGGISQSRSTASSRGVVGRRRGSISKPRVSSTSGMERKLVSSRRFIRKAIWSIISKTGLFSMWSGTQRMGI